MSLSELFEELAEAGASFVSVHYTEVHGLFYGTISFGPLEDLGTVTYRGTAATPTEALEDAIEAMRQNGTAEHKALAERLS